MYNSLCDCIIKEGVRLKNNSKKLGEAELEIMQVIWKSREPVTSNYILKELQGKRKWQLSTLMTSLSRLCEKGFVSCDRTTGMNLYTSLIAENDYKATEGRSFLKRLYDNSIQNMVATLYGRKALPPSEVEELRAYLNELLKEDSTQEEE